MQGASSSPSVSIRVKRKRGALPVASPPSRECIDVDADDAIPNAPHSSRDRDPGDPAGDPSPPSEINPTATEAQDDYMAHVRLAYSALEPGLDLVSEVRGKELSPHAPVVRWNNTTRTVVPFIPVSKNSEKNLLTSDAAALRRLAKRALPAFKFNFVHKASPIEPRFVDQCRKSLSGGNLVLVRAFQKPRTPPPSLTENYLRDTLKLDVEFAQYDSHSASERKPDFAHPHVALNLRDFLRGIQDHHVIHCILSVASRTLRTPPFIQDDLDDSYASFIHDHPDLFNDHPSYDTVSRDSIEARTWNLLHGAGYLTLAHKDADGMGTYVIVESGVKMWCAIRPGDGYMTAKTFPELFSKAKVMTDGDSDGFHRDWEKTQSQVVLLELHPGDLLLMPPGTWHEVYTPIQGITSGGHFLSYDTMHLTAFSRKHDFEQGTASTNASHPATYRTLCRMMVQMVRITNRTFYRKPVAAHCSMVVAWNEYTQEGQSAQASTEASFQPDCRLAGVIAKVVLKHLGIRDIKEDYEVFFEGETWMDPGPAADLSNAFVVFDNTVLRPRHGAVDPPHSIDWILRNFAQ